MMLANEENLREVVAFPMNQQAEDLLMGSPNEVSNKQINDLGLELKKITEISYLIFLFFKYYVLTSLWIVFL